MKLLFVHNNFPAQFKHVAPMLARQGRYEVAALHKRTDLPDAALGMQLHAYTPARALCADAHPWLTQVENAVIHAHAAARKADLLKRQGYTPDVIIGHHGWGELMFLREIWPNARMGVYCELYYRARNSGWDFDPEFPDRGAHTAPCRTRLLNVPFDLSFADAVSGLSPTGWQAATFPEAARARISVVHDGIDTRAVRASSAAILELPGGGQLTHRDEVFTFVSRHLEPYRGFHIFMRALPELLRLRPNAHVVVVGAEGREGGYGPLPEGGGSWKQRFVDEVRPKIGAADWARVHFLGRIPYEQFVRVLQRSTVHIYLTAPFVLSWSLLEAMSASCAIVASDTAPVREVVHDGVNGVLTDFFDVDALAQKVAALAADPFRRLQLGTAARSFVQTYYDVRTCMPKQAAWIDSVAGEAVAAPDA